MRWKKAELSLAAWVKGKRSGARGVAQPDVVAERGTFEVKSRTDVPGWLLKAFDQAKINARICPDLPAYVAIFAHFGRGTPRRIFICREVDLSEDFQKVLDELDEQVQELEVEQQP